MTNIFQTQRWGFVPPSKVPNVKSFYDNVDLKNKVKVNLWWHEIKSLEKNWTLIHKIHKWGCNDLILSMPSSIHLRCLQVSYGTSGHSGLETICLFRWKPIDFHWKCLLLLWPWQRLNWSGSCKLGRCIYTHNKNIHLWPIKSRN